MNLREEFQEEIRLARMEEERETRTLESEIEDLDAEVHDLTRRLTEMTATAGQAAETAISLRTRVRALEAENTALAASLGKAIARATITPEA